jgi:hypothetical protein
LQTGSHQDNDVFTANEISIRLEDDGTTESDGLLFGSAARDNNFIHRVLIDDNGNPIVKGKATTYFLDELDDTDFTKMIMFLCTTSRCANLAGLPMSTASGQKWGPILPLSHLLCHRQRRLLEFLGYPCPDRSSDNFAASAYLEGPMTLRADNGEISTTEEVLQPGTAIGSTLVVHAQPCSEMMTSSNPASTRAPFQSGTTRLSWLSFGACAVGLKMTTSAAFIWKLMPVCE